MEVSSNSTDGLGDYIADLAREAELLRNAHGGRRRWWRGHKPDRCAFCLHWRQRP